MKHGEQFGEWPEEELPKELFNIEILKTKINAKKLCNCYDRKFEVDPINKFVSCTKCGAIIDPFEAIYEIARSRERIVEENKRLLDQRQEIKNYKPHLLVIKNLEKHLRSGDMLPTCPHCDKPFELGKLDHWVNKKYYKVEGIT
jgi:hypothetical protein